MKRLIPLILVLLLLGGLAVHLMAGAAPEALVNTFGVGPEQDTSAQSILVLDRDSGASLYEKNADDRIYPASTTKLMTALCALDEVRDLDGTVVTVRQEVLDLLPDNENSLAGLTAGEELTMRQLLYCMLLPSGNDAALVIADYVGGGSQEAFAKQMNHRASKLGCRDTHFVNPHGLAREEHYSTARDLGLIAEEYLRQPALAEIACTRSYTFDSNIRGTVTVWSTNRLLFPDSDLYEPAATGVKTGVTSLGACFISSGEQDGLRVLCVAAGVPALNGDGSLITPNPAVAEGRKFLSWACDRFVRVTLYDGQSPVSVPREGTGQVLTATARGPITAVLPREQADVLTGTVTAKKTGGLYLPGMTVGTAAWYCGETPVLTGVPLMLGGGVWVIPLWFWLALAAVLAALLALTAALIRRRKRPVPEKVRNGGAGDQARGTEWIKETPPDQDWYY